MVKYFGNYYRLSENLHCAVKKLMAPHLVLISDPLFNTTPVHTSSAECFAETTVLLLIGSGRIWSSKVLASISSVPASKHILCGPQMGVRFRLVQQ